MRYRLQRHDGTDCSATMVPIQRYRHKKGKNTIYTLEDIVSFIDITTITKHFEIYKITSFYELFTENISIKYSYQHLDKLIRKGHSDIIKTQLEKLKKILRKENFKLIHNDKVTYIKSSRKNKHEVIYYQDTTQRDGKIDLSLVTILFSALTRMFPKPTFAP